MERPWNRCGVLLFYFTLARSPAISMQPPFVCFTKRKQLRNSRSKRKNRLDNTPTNHNNNNLPVIKVKLVGVDVFVHENVFDVSFQFCYSVWLIYVVELRSQSLSFPYNRLRAANSSCETRAPKRVFSGSSASRSKMYTQFIAEHSLTRCCMARSTWLGHQISVLWTFIASASTAMTICLRKIFFSFLQSVCVEQTLLLLLVRLAWLNKLIIIWIELFSPYDGFRHAVHRAVSEKRAAAFATQMATHTPTSCSI